MKTKHGFNRTSRSGSSVKLGVKGLLRDYHERFMDTVDSLFSLDGRYVLEVGCGNGALLTEFAKRGAARVIGIDLCPSHTTESQTVTVMRMDVCNLEFEDECFDYVFSVATLEHVNDVPRALGEIHRVLKRGGEFFTRFGPIWTAVNGHHYRLWNHEGKVFIPPWGHLALTREELYRYVERRHGQAEAENACRHVYDSQEINRLPYREYVEAFKSAPFRHKKVELLMKERAKVFLPYLRSRLAQYRDEELLVSGFIVRMRK